MFFESVLWNILIFGEMGFRFWYITFQVEKTADVNTERKPRDSSREEEEEDSKEKKIKNGGETDAKKPRHEKLERLEAFSKRLRHYILKRVNHRRHRSPWQTKLKKML